MTEMTDVNIKLSINTSSLLPSKLEYSMPEKDISKDDSNKYVSVYFDEYRSLHKIFESELEDKKEIKLLQEDIYMNYLPKVGTCDKSLKLFISALIDLLPFGLFNCNFKSEMVSLANVLGKSTWNYILSTTSTVLPLFVTTVYNMFTPQDFQVSPSSLSSLSLLSLLIHHHFSIKAVIRLHMVLYKSFPHLLTKHVDRFQ